MFLTRLFFLPSVFILASEPGSGDFIQHGPSGEHGPGSGGSERGLGDLRKRACCATAAPDPADELPPLRSLK
jgi:hypothetical protein